MTGWYNTILQPYLQRCNVLPAKATPFHGSYGTSEIKNCEMAAIFLSTANTFHSSSSSSSSSASSSSHSLPPVTRLLYPQNQNFRLRLPLNAVQEAESSSLVFTKRSVFWGSISSFIFSFADIGSSAVKAAILEPDDDEELLERVKMDRKKRLEKQGVISSSSKETGYLQELVYKLSRIGQAIDDNDLSGASSILGKSADTDWIQKANSAFTKLSSRPEEKSEVDSFNSSLVSLISSVTRNDVESSKAAFVSSASAFQKWTALTGLVAQLEGL